MLGRTVVAALCALLLVGSVAGPADAGRRDARDGRGDVWRVNQGGTDRPVPGVTNGDLTATRFRHGSRNIVVAARFAELRRIGRYAKLVVRLENGRDRYREVEVVAAPGSRFGRADVFTRNGRFVRCPARHRIDYDANTIRVAVPRRCLRTPQYVRATAAFWWYSDAGNVYTDNPHNARAAVGAWTRWIPAG